MQPLWLEVRIVLVILVVTCFVWHKRHVRFAFSSLYMYVVRLLPYYFGTVYIPTFNLQVFLNGLSRKLQPVFSYGSYLNYQARESRKGLLNQHSQRPTLLGLQMESLKTCTHDICWSDLFWFRFVFVWLLPFFIMVYNDCFFGVQPFWFIVQIELVNLVFSCDKFVRGLVRSCLVAPSCVLLQC